MMFFMVVLDAEEDLPRRNPHPRNPQLRKLLPVKEGLHLLVREVPQPLAREVHLLLAREELAERRLLINKLNN